MPGTGKQPTKLKDLMMPKDGSRRRVRRGRFDNAGMVVTLGSGPSEHRYTCNGLPASVQSYLTLLGLKFALLSNKDADLAYEALKAGTVPEQRPQAPARKSKWREAIAYALAVTKVQQLAPKGTRKAVIDQMVQAEMPTMQAHASTLPKETVRKLAERADVQEVYRRLFGTKAADAQTSLFALAGVLDPNHQPQMDFPGAGAPDYGAGQNQAA
jgi:hypothetical protein